MLLINLLQKMKSQFLVCLQIKKSYLNIYKLKKHFKKGLTPLLCALTVFNICGINVSAASYVSFNIVEPSIPERGGYVIVMGKNGTAQMFYTQLLPYSYFPLNSEIADFTYEFAQAQVTVTSGYIRFTYNCIGTTNVGSEVDLYNYATVYTYNADNKEYEVRYNHGQNGTHSYEYHYDTWGGEITGVIVKGNFWSYNIQNGLKTDFNVVWGEDVALFDRLANSNLILQEIRNALVPSSTPGAPSDVSNSQINTVEDKENALIGSDVSTNDLNVSINANAASVVWNLVDDVVTRNAKVFTMFISILTIAVIGLILNR